ncbi:hypothetical protein ACFV4P_13205 [Kitasatospora sp. NPDC059795]|uniref:hypothetical protein n=1 Tax=Kitasatospora sp. NPDC059795 TaxID=3346949 RepID=UPI003668E828
MDTWQELDAVVAERLRSVSSEERQVFAAGVAERLMRRHEALSEGERAPFTLSLRPLLDAVWEGVLGDSTAFAAINRGVAEYMLSEYCHNDGQHGPDDADESAAAAALYAAHAYLFGCRKYARWNSGRALEAVELHLEQLSETVEVFDADQDEAMSAELRRQLRDLDLIAGFSNELRYANLGLPVDTSTRLRAELREPLSSESLLPLLAGDEDVVAFFAAVADLDATSPDAHELEDGIRLASGARLEQFARAATGDAYCFVGDGGEERPVVYVSLDGEAGLIAVGLPELVRLCLAVPWWGEVRGGSLDGLGSAAADYRADIPDLDARRDRAARALGLDPTTLPAEATALARLAELSRGPVAETCLVLGGEGKPLEPLFLTTAALA